MLCYVCYDSYPALEEVRGAVSTIISSDANKFKFFASIKTQAHNFDIA